MARNGETHEENIALSALLIVTNEENGLTRDGRVFDLQVGRRMTNPGSRASYGIAELRTKTSPVGVQLQKRISKVGRTYRYKLYLADVKVGSNWSVLIAAPMRELFEEIRPATDLRYCRCDLRAICNDQFVGPRDANVSIARLNARVFGESRVKSVALYGNGVIASDVLKDILGRDLVDRRDGPFLPKGRVTPNSCRLVWNDGQSKPFALNADLFGNYSFYLRTIEELPALLAILSYADALGAIKTDVVVDPLNRSPTELRRVSE